MNIGAVGTAIVYAKFIFLPHKKEAEIPPGLSLPIIILTGAIIAGIGVYNDAYTLQNIIKALAIIGVGWVGYRLFQRFAVSLPRVLEQFEHLIGFMSLMLLLLLGMILA
jgi:multicomponent Na+:H+ antiporter subunit D